MADLPFLDKLDKNQLEIADKIITKSQEMGIDPRLALSLAYVESNLKPQATSEKGAVGVMQVMPATGEMLGVDRKKLRDVDTNIEVGLRYLKQGIDRYKDPQLAAVGYNAGMDHPFLLGKSEKLPEESLGYVNKINSYGGFDVPEAATEVPPAPKVEVTPASEGDYRSTKAAALGASLGSSAGAVQSFFPGAKGAQGAQASAAAAGAPSGANTSGAKWASKVVGRVAPGADSVAEQAQSWNRVKGQGPVTSRLSSRFGVTEPGQIGKLSVQSTGQAPGMMQKAVSGLEDAGKFLTKHRIAGGALAGAGAGFGAQEAMDRYNRGDMLGAGVAGVGALGSMASMIPHPLTRGIGTAVGMASPLALSVLDRIHNQSAQAPQPQQ
jgi:hypothetical protein